jgi:hypothetical protein
MTGSFGPSVLFIIILCIGLIDCQITDAPRDQPFVYTNNLTKCCQYLESSQELLHCANKSASNHFYKDTMQTKIASVSYSTSGILDYGAYSMAVNTFYSEVNSYGMRLLTPEDGARYEPRDERWNKVKILLDALNPETGWGRQLEYILWLDSDLIFLDIGMKIEEIMENYKSYDILFSADPQLENGVVNSGLFIVKNNEWSRQFLHDWWYSYDRILGMDQHIFSKLWESGQPDIANHIKILRTDALNTHFPSWVHQKPHNQILHLAGVSGIMRQLSFKEAFTQICRHVNTHEAAISVDSDSSSVPTGVSLKQLPRQLGVDRQFLINLYTDLPRGAVVKQILGEMRGRTGKNISFAEIKKLSRSLTDVLQMGFLKEGEDSAGFSMADSILEGLAWTYTTLRDVTSHMESAEAKLEGAQLVLEAMFSYAMRLAVTDPAATLQVLKECEPTLDFLLGSVATVHYGPALYYKFKHREFPAPIYESLERPQEALEAYEEAMAVWWEMHEHKSYGSGNGAVDPYFEGSRVLESIAALSCQTGQHAKGLEAVQHIVDFYQEIFAPKSAASIPNKVRLLHGNRLGLGAQCARDMGDFSLSHRLAGDAISVLSAAQGENTDVTVQALFKLQVELAGRTKSADGARGIHTSDSSSSSSGKATKRMMKRKKKTGA